MKMFISNDRNVREFRWCCIKMQNMLQKRKVEIILGTDGEGTYSVDSDEIVGYRQEMKFCPYCSKPIQRGDECQ